MIPDSWFLTLSADYHFSPLVFSLIQTSKLFFHSQSPLCRSGRLCNRKQVCWRVLRQTQWCSSAGPCCVHSISCCIYKASSSLAFLKWLTFLPSPLSFSYYYLIIAGLLMGSEPICPPSFLPSFLPFLVSFSIPDRPFCRVIVGNWGEIKKKQVHRAAVMDPGVSAIWTPFCFL